MTDTQVVDAYRASWAERRALLTMDSVGHESSLNAERQIDLRDELNARGLDDPAAVAEMERAAVTDDTISYRAAVDTAILEHGEALLGRMIADGAKDTSDAEIERTLGPCVCGGMLVKIAKEMRRRGLLVLVDRCFTLREVLPGHWVALIAKHDACVVTTPGGPDLLAWGASDACSLDIISATADADALCAKWPEQADALRDIACRHIGILAWG